MYRLWSTVCPGKPAPNSHPPHQGCLVRHVGTGSTPPHSHANVPALWQAQVFCQHPAWTVTGFWMIDQLWSVSGAANRSWHWLFHWSHWGPARPSFCHSEGHERRAPCEAWVYSWPWLQWWKLGTWLWNLPPNSSFNSGRGREGYLCFSPHHSFLDYPLPQSLSTHSPSSF